MKPEAPALSPWAISTLLQENASKYRWAAAITGAQSAAGYQLASELPVMAIGGFNGSDPSPTLDQFKSFVEEGLVRYYISSNGMGGNQMGAPMPRRKSPNGFLPTSKRKP